MRRHYTILLLLLVLLTAGATGGGANLEEEDWVFEDEEEEGDADEGGEEEPQLSPEDKLLDGARGDDIVMVKEALAEGADPNLTLQDETKWSVLMMALYWVQVGRWVGPAGAEYRSTGAEIARVLIEAGADIEYRRPIPGGGTALAYAAEWGRLAAVNMLIEMGAEVDARSHGKKVEEESKKKGRKSRKKKKVKMGGNTPLMAASWAGHLPVVEALLDGGADPRLSNEGGVTAKAMAHKKGNHEIVKLLEKRVAEK